MALHSAQLTIDERVGSTQVTITDTQTASGKAELSGETIPAPQAGTLTTRTDNETGVVTTTATPIVTTADTVRAVWTGGERVGMSVTNVAGNAVTVDGGTGTNLPAESTAITIAKECKLTFGFNGDGLKHLVVKADEDLSLDFLDSAGASVIAAAISMEDGDVYLWIYGVSFLPANPFAGDAVAKIQFTNLGTADATPDAIAIFDPTP